MRGIVRRGTTTTRAGVNPADAKARVASLTDDEAAQLASKIDNLPAGGDGVGALIGALLIIFIVLLITDILGVTHVFPTPAAVQRLTSLCRISERALSMRNV